MADSVCSPKARGALLKRDSACARTFNASAASMPDRWSVGSSATWASRARSSKRKLLTATPKYSVAASSSAWASSKTTAS